MSTDIETTEEWITARGIRQDSWNCNVYFYQHGFQSGKYYNMGESPGMKPRFLSGGGHSAGESR